MSVAEEVPSRVQFPDDFFFSLDPRGPIPLYFQVARRIETAIRTGELAPGAWIENEISLGNRLGISRPTIRRALQQLADNGLVVRRRGIGTQVVQGPAVRKMSLTSLYEDLELDRKNPTTHVLHREVISASEEIASRTGWAVGGPVLHLRRLRLSNEQPVALMENFLRAELDSITTEQLTRRGLYQLIRGRGITMKIARQTIGARRPTVQERRLLNMFPSDPLLTVERVAFDRSGAAVELGRHAFRPDLYQLEVTLVD